MAAATRAKAKAASKSGFCFGRTKAAKATIKPSRTYFTTRLHNSRASNIFNIYIIDKKNTKTKKINLIKEIIEIPSNKTIEHELEVVLLIGKEGVPKNREEAHTFISGFSIGLDLTDRHLQTELKKKGMPWFASKTFKGSAVIDANFIHECPQEFYLKVNQKIRQEGNLKDMIFSFEDIILHLSKTVGFKKGDIIFTGTPEGVGALESGDQIEMGFNNYPPKKLVVI